MVQTPDSPGPRSLRLYLFVHSFACFPHFLLPISDQSLSSLCVLMHSGGTDQSTVSGGYGAAPALQVSYLYFFSPQHQCNVIPLTTTLQRISVDVYTDTETCVQCVQLTGSVLGVFLIPSPASLSPQRLCCVSCFVTAKPLIYAFMQLS